MTDHPHADDRLALHAEVVAVTKKVRETTLVRAIRTTSTRHEAVDHELAREAITIEVVPIGRMVDAVPPVRQEGETTIMPVVEEIVVVERRLVLKEEVRITRVRTVERHVETVSLRTQDATVTRTEIKDRLAGTEMADAGPSPPLPTNPSQTGPTDMNDETIVAVYDTPAHAALAVADLKQAGIPDSAITSHAVSGDRTTTTGTPVREEGFWASLFGGEPDYDTTVYDRSMASGSTVVTVKASETYSAKAAEILESHAPIDIDERAATYGIASTGMATQHAVSPVAPVALAAGAKVAEGGSIQLAEERLAVGKRVVNRGGTRIRRYVVETPVEEQVTLHDEKVTLERRPVTDGRPITDADFTDKTIEMTETAEEAVVSKQAFVTEEIALRKQATDRVETVRDTLRKEEVEIEQVPGETVTTTSTGPVTPASRPVTRT